jgi:Holliday junction resolvasome RuvABC endonuclease subunit
MTGILAIDPATNSGWAHKARQGAPPTYGAVMIDGKNARFLYNFRGWMVAIMGRLQPDSIYYEPPFVGKINSIKKLYQLQGVLELTALDAGLPCKAAAVQSWRSHFLGKGWSLKGLPKDSRRRELKAAVRQQCKILGWPTTGDDEADALGILDYACAVERWGAAPAGLFAAGAA